MKIIRPITITDAMLTASNVAETDYAAYAAGTTYADGDTVIVTASGVHKVYESLKGANTGHYPPDNTTGADPWWLEVSPTNRWKVFDQAVGTQTSQATSITYTITPGELFDAIAFINLDAVTVQVVVTDSVDGEVYNQTIDLQTTVVTTGEGEVYDWYTYFFSSYFRISDAVKLDIPLYLNGVIDITITYTGGTAKVGCIIIGLQTDIGTTKYSPAIGIHDYSTKEADSFGIYDIVERAFSKKMSCDVSVQNICLDNIFNILAYYRAVPLVWIASEDYSSLIIYGYYKDFSITIPYPSFSVCSIDIEGLT